jgi:4-amino-4-deoxy-L-arabinose transferase-like glycosyltransferase
MHRQQDRSLFFYATAIQRQLSFGPQAEMSILHLSVLSGSDRLANFVQYFAMVGCVVGVSLLAEKLGGGIDAQSFAALATMTLPIGVLQATSTQNDYVVSFWCLCFTLFVLEQIKKTDTDTLAGFAGVALGLAMLTKATAILFLAPVGTWFMIHLIHRNRFGAVRLFSMVAVVSIVIVFPHFFRTYRLYGNPLGITSGLELGKLTNDVFSPAIAASNILRNVGLQLASPMEGLNQLMQSGIGWAHARLGIDISDPRSTWQDLQFRMEFSMYEDSAGNPLHFLVVLFAIPCLVRSGSRGKTTYLLCLVSGFILFCALLKWQPWNSRLILPLFILAMPVVAVLLSGCLRKGRVFLPGILLAVGAIPYIFTNPSRPLIGSNNIFTGDRFHEYFANVPDDPFIYDAAARMIGEARCDQIGLAGSPDGREYLVWVSNQIYNQNAHIEHILVRNISRKLQTDFTPCAIVVQYPIEEQVLGYENYNYQRMIGNERFSLYLTSERLP